MRRLTLALAVIAAGTGGLWVTSPIGLGAISAIRSGTIQVELGSPLFFLPATASCPAGRAHGRLTTLDGRTVGALESCIQSFIPTGSNSQNADLRLTFHLAGGVIRASVISSETFNDTFTTFNESWDGIVTGGSGQYIGARGTVGGGGTLSFAGATPTSDIVAVIELG
jgi:hypothetical protein